MKGNRIIPWHLCAGRAVTPLGNEWKHREAGLSKCAAHMHCGVLNSHDAVKGTNQASKILKIIELALWKAEKLLVPACIEFSHFSLNFPVLQAYKCSFVNVNQLCQLI